MTTGFVVVVQFNFKSGEPAPESITDKIYDQTQTVSTSSLARIVLTPLCSAYIKKQCSGHYSAFAMGNARKRLGFSAGYLLEGA